MKSAEKPLEQQPYCANAHELMSKGLCKERSDEIAIVTLCVNRVQSYSLNICIFFIIKTAIFR